MKDFTKIRCIIVLFSLSCANFCFARPYYGAVLSYVAASKEPPDLKGYQFVFQYDPDQLKWYQFNLYFDLGLSHFKSSNALHNKSISILAAAPVIRYQLLERHMILPFLEFSIGLSYLSRTRIQHRNLGIHFAFQDRIGIGAFLGRSKNLLVGLHVVHYSNAHLSGRNSGITLPLVLDVGYRFQ